MSLNIALSGLNASNQELNNISNNIANVGTTGFKSSRTEFSAIYNGSSAGGVEVSGISQDFEKSGNITGTGRSLDMAISGSGFFITENAKGQALYSRSGVMNMNAEGFLVSNSGAALQGYTVDADNNLQQGNVGSIQINTSSLEANPTTKIEFLANLDSREIAPTPILPATTVVFDPSDSSTFNHSYTTPVYDSLGNQSIVPSLLKVIV